MHTILNRILFSLAAAIVLLDAVWLVAAHFEIDSARYNLLFLLVLPLVGAAYYYGEVRHEAAISATLAGASFLLVFSASASLLSYLLLTVAGPRIDAELAAVDHAIGFSWPALMTFVAEHPPLNSVLGFAYVSVMPQTTVLILYLGWWERTADLYGLCLATALGATVALVVWTAFPSFGAFSVFTLPPNVASKLGLVLGFDYGRRLVDMLNHGPGFISPSELRGLVGFPSFHTVQVLTLMWYARNLGGLRWIAVALNTVVLISIPVQGGHHLIDMVGGAVVTSIGIAAAESIVARASRRPAVARLTTSQTPLTENEI